MSAYSTISVTETKARTFILGKVMTMDRAELGELMDKLLAERLYRTSIVPDGDDDNEDHRLDFS